MGLSPGFEGELHRLSDIWPNRALCARSGGEERPLREAFASVARTLAEQGLESNLCNALLENLEGPKTWLGGGNPGGLGLSNSLALKSSLPSDGGCHISSPPSRVQYSGSRTYGCCTHVIPH